MVTYKASDALTLATETAWVRDDYGLVGRPVNAIGIAQYASYTLTDTLTLNGRIEYFRDDNNFLRRFIPQQQRAGPGGTRLCAIRPCGARDKHDLWRDDHWRYLEAGVTCADYRAGDTPRSAVGSRIHQQPPIQCPG